METQSHTEVVQAPVAACYAAVVDFEKYPEWFSGISGARIIEADPSANRWTVRYELNMIVKTVSYTLAYEGDPPALLRWKMTEGDVNGIEGTYEFIELEPGVTEATCSQSIDVGFWIPGPIKRTFEKSALSDSVREFKTAAEAAASARA